MSTAGSTWTPTVDTEADSLLKRQGTLSDSDRQQILNEALRVLGRCVDPDPTDWNRAEASAELVVGEVQSGKTMSFTTLTALARDNGFPLVIVLAGTKKNLMAQTLERLQKDLKMEGDGGLPRWQPVNMSERGGQVDELESAIEVWQADPRSKPATTVVVVLKNRARLDAARDAMKELTLRCGTFPALIIDDEGDQAGLNLLARQKEKESPTYRAIRGLREALPLHSYVIYTATPQAPLLVGLTDTVSPRTVTVLTSGTGYVGAEKLFVEKKGTFEREILDNDDALDPDRQSPPASLERALATYLVALVISQMRENPRPLSMLIHPSATTDLHKTYEGWVRGIIHDRLRLALGSGSPDAVEEVRERLLRPAYDDLSDTGGTIVNDEVVPLEDIVSELRKYLPFVRIKVINSEDGVEIKPTEWKQCPGWILIGGAKLDRGFTVENLAVTYMPRGPGIKNADTIQQRGRFFGYRSHYVELLRAWLNPDTLEIYRQYVDHERQMQKDLRHYDEHSKPLKQWRRQFLIDPSMNLTRSQVINLDTDTVSLASGWHLRQEHLYSGTPSLSPDGVKTLESLFSQADRHPRDNRTGDTHHTILTVGWDRVAPLLADWEAAPTERSRIEGLLLAADADKTVRDVDVIFMDGLKPRRRGPQGSRSGERPTVPRTDADAEDLQIGQLFQGPSAQYPGDGAFRSDDRITIQVHHVVPERAGRYGEQPVYALAIHLPKRMGSFVRQR